MVLLGKVPCPLMRFQARKAVKAPAINHSMPTIRKAKNQWYGLLQKATATTLTTASVSSLLPGLVGGFISNRYNLIVSGGSILLNIGGNFRYLGPRLSYLAALDRVDSVRRRELARWV